MGGLFISSFTIIPILIIFVFGIPITRKLEKLDLVSNNNGIIRNYFISVAVLSLIFLGTFYAIDKFFPSLLIGFYIGLVMTLVLGLGKVGANSNNITDYIQTNQKHFKSTSEEVLEAIAK